MTNFKLEPGKRNLLLIIDSCKSVEELTELWKTLTSTEQHAYKGFFTEKKRILVSKGKCGIIKKD